MRRELAKLANDIDDARTTVEELESEARYSDSAELPQKLKELRPSLEDAADCVDELEDSKRK